MNSDVWLFRSILITLIALSFSLLTPPAYADIPPVINYQGKITDGSGIPVSDGNYDMRFNIFDVETGGTSLWYSGTLSVPVTGGIFNVLLGETPGQPIIDLLFDEDYWLNVWIEGNTQTPRQRLSSTGYAFMANRSDTASVAMGFTPGIEVSGSVTTAPDAVIKSINTATSGFYHGIAGVSASTNGCGLYGYASAASGVSRGVYAVSISPNGIGVYGLASSTVGGVSYGGRFESKAPGGIGVEGTSTTTTPGGACYGGKFEAASSNGYGISGTATATSGQTNGVYGKSSSISGRGVHGYASTSTGSTYGGYFQSSSESGKGVYGYAYSNSGVNYGVYGQTQSPSGFGGYFDGDLHTTGTLSKGSGSFLIDHPLDPENKLLRHNFVESPENLLIYRGTIRLNAGGEAIVDLPAYFAALTLEGNASIQLTPIGSPFLTGYEWRDDNTTFVIIGDAGRKVSWMVLADRDDPVIHQLNRPVEEDKGPNNKYCNRGQLIYPEAFGYPKSMGRDYHLHNEEVNE